MTWSDKLEAEVHKILELPSGNKVHFRQMPPHGMWEIAFDKGPLPKILQSRYTNYALALSAWNSYYSTAKHLQVPPPAKRLKEALKDAE